MRWPWSRMAVRVIDRQPFGEGGVVEGLVGGDERDRSQVCRLLEMVDMKGNRQLHGVIGPEPVLASDPHGVGDQGGGKLDDAIALDEMAAEMAVDRGGLRGDADLCTPAAGDNGRDFDGGDA